MLESLLQLRHKIETVVVRGAMAARSLTLRKNSCSGKSASRRS